MKKILLGAVALVAGNAALNAAIFFTAKSGGSVKGAIEEIKPYFTPAPINYKRMVG